MSGRRRWAPAFSVSLAAALYTHNWALFLALGSLAVLGPLQLGDLQLEVRDQGGVVGDLGLGAGRAGLRSVGPQLGCDEGGAQRRRLFGTELKPFLHKGSRA